MKAKIKWQAPDAEAPIQAQYEAKMREIAVFIDQYFNGDVRPKATGFALLVFPFGQPDGDHRANYLSNADREDMLATMKEFIARAEGRYVAGEAQKGTT